MVERHEIIGIASIARNPLVRACALRCVHKIVLHLAASKVVDIWGEDESGERCGRCNQVHILQTSLLVKELATLLRVREGGATEFKFVGNNVIETLGLAFVFSSGGSHDYFVGLEKYLAGLYGLKN